MADQCVKHPERKSKVRGMCQSCYQLDRRRVLRPGQPAAKCHPDRPHYAKGLCFRCSYDQWYASNKERRHTYNKRFHAKHRDKRRRYRLLKRTGIVADVDYDAMLNEQGDVCAICKRTDRYGRCLALDHDHKTKEVRGLLCTDCNVALGKFHDDPILLKRAAEYLLKNRHLSLVHAG